LQHRSISIQSGKTKNSKAILLKQKVYKTGEII
jgi:hypothetical protein